MEDIKNKTLKFVDTYRDQVIGTLIGLGIVYSGIIGYKIGSIKKPMEVVAEAVKLNEKGIVIEKATIKYIFKK